VAEDVFQQSGEVNSLPRPGSPASIRSKEQLKCPKWRLLGFAGTDRGAWAANKTGYGAAGLFNAETLLVDDFGRLRQRVRSSCAREVSRGLLFHGLVLVRFLSLDPSLNMLNMTLHHGQCFGKFI